ncbi:hypothetical protein, partial [Agrobacterium sp. MS2]|uniref:hypothetical protein n=1 Tax=Agrobacterium sp. MS2 TaxID=1345498 RepID=UPI001AEC7818
PCLFTGGEASNIERAFRLLKVVSKIQPEIMNHSMFAIEERRYSNTICINQRWLARTEGALSGKAGIFLAAIKTGVRASSGFAHTGHRG